MKRHIFVPFKANSKQKSILVWQNNIRPTSFPLKLVPMWPLSLELIKKMSYLWIFWPNFVISKVLQFFSKISQFFWIYIEIKIPFYFILFSNFTSYWPTTRNNKLNLEMVDYGMKKDSIVGTNINHQLVYVNNQIFLKDKG